MTEEIEDPNLCPQCEDPIARMSEDVWTTCVGYSSPSGHDHDDNCETRGVTCPNGHAWIISRRRRCPACDWKGKEHCFCHHGWKVDEWPKTEIVPSQFRTENEP